MSELSKRSMIYSEENVHQVLRIKAATSHKSVSKVVSEPVRKVLILHIVWLYLFVDTLCYVTYSM